jgi:hypothetical protein
MTQLHVAFAAALPALQASVQVTTGDSPVGLKIAKDVAATVQSIATVVALLAGAWWLFKRRRNYPRAKFTHDVTHVRLSEELVLVYLAVLVENVGDILIRLGSSRAFVQQLSPFPTEYRERLASGGKLLAEGSSEAGWPVVARCERDWTGNELEPGESSTFQFELAISATLDTVLVYSYFRNVAKATLEIGWNASTVYPLREPAAGPNSARPTNGGSANA